MSLVRPFAIAIVRKDRWPHCVSDMTSAVIIVEWNLLFVDQDVSVEDINKIVDYRFYRWNKVE